MRVMPLAALLAVLALPRPARAGLDDYLAKPEPAFKWEKRGETQVGACTAYELHFTSLEWHGEVWEHRLLLVRPDKGERTSFCALDNSSGEGERGDAAEAARFAEATGSCAAVVFGNPKQPLWGKREDALVVHTWLEFVKSMKQDGKGDESWPLHFPMAKAVVKGMDVIQAFAKQAGLPAIESFGVSGGSKQGWTSWLVGASGDPRVKAIAPRVIDILNVKAQAVHQIETWGKASEQVKQYTEAGMPALFDTPEGKRLLDIEDPYSYRDRLKLPKLIVIGTNDPHWTLDALNLYWDGLQGPKWILYVPNAGHSIKDERLAATMAAFVRATAGGARLPEPRWTYAAASDGSLELTVTSDVAPAEVRLWVADSKSRDFRDSRWRSELMAHEGAAWRAGADRPAEGARAIFGEVVYSIDGRRFTLSTQLRVLEAPRRRRWL
jgi:PhoPQ-activated pathogenicity-related protein